MRVQRLKMPVTEAESWDGARRRLSAGAGKSFAEALVRFGGRVASARVLSAIASGNEAVLLYDIDVQGLGAMRRSTDLALTGPLASGQRLPSAGWVPSARECLDWMLIFNGAHLEHVLAEFVAHYNDYGRTLA